MDTQNLVYTRNVVLFRGTNPHIMISEIRQSQEDKLYKVLRVIKFTDRKQKGSCQSLEGERDRGSLTGTEFQFHKMERVPEVDGGNGCTTL